MYFLIFFILFFFGCAANAPERKAGGKKQLPQAEQSSSPQNENNSSEQKEGASSLSVSYNGESMPVKEKTIYLKQGAQRLTISLDPENEFYKELNRGGDAQSLKKNKEVFECGWGVYLFPKDVKEEFEDKGLVALVGKVKDLTKQAGVTISDPKDPSKLTINFPAGLLNSRKEGETIAVNLIVYKKIDELKNDDPELPEQFELAYLFTLYVEEMP